MSKIIQTKASLLKKIEEVKVVKFEERKKNHRIPKYFPKEEETPEEVEKSQSDQEFDEIFSDDPPPKKKKKVDTTEFNFQKARREIQNFAIGGSEKKESQDSQIALLIKLGARPPKKGYKNYKELLVERKKEIAEESKVDKRNMFGSSKTLQLRNQKKNKSRDDGLLKRYGRVEKNDQQKKPGKGMKNKRK